MTNQSLVCAVNTLVLVRLLIGLLRGNYLIMPAFTINQDGSDDGINRCKCWRGNSYDIPIIVLIFEV